MVKSLKETWKMGSKGACTRALNTTSNSKVPLPAVGIGDITQDRVSTTTSSSGSEKSCLTDSKRLEEVHGERNGSGGLEVAITGPSEVEGGEPFLLVPEGPPARKPLSRVRTQTVDRIRTRALGLFNNK
ncbi:hypothetical protein E2C01_011297 [Portunus trituberculatus]|uniref:Uncharacterized protein n=1 Tax=Portunus trituberculatus TaxID=210409 RepID=A0A5B7DAR1_PORTR|nr:hypothetical protein [Portunus trituberculatus]